jgi:hypothetical protein
MGMEDYRFALEFKETLARLVKEEVERTRPRYRIATVVSFDRVLRKCTVTFPGDTTNEVVNMGSIQPKTAGQVVRIAGLSGDRYVDDVLGDAYSAAPEIEGATEYAFTDDSATTHSSPTAATLGARGGQASIVAPASGSFVISIRGRVGASASNVYAALGYEVREGSTIGSGTVVIPFDTARSFINWSSNRITAGVTMMINGLTPGANYNIRMMMASQTGAGTFEEGAFILTPQP